MRLRARRNVTTEARSPLERPAVYAGALRDPNESGALTVTLSVWSDQIVMHNDDVELGEWSRGSVRIIPLDSSSYEFVAEGDRLIFIPDDRAEFDAVATPSVPSGSPQAADQRKMSKSRSGSAKKTSRSTVARVTSAIPSSATTKRIKKAKQPKKTKAAAAATASEPSQSTTKKPKRIRTRAARASDTSAAHTDTPSRPWRRAKTKPTAQQDPKPATSAEPRQPVVPDVTPSGGAVATTIRRNTAVEAEVDGPKKQRRSLKARRAKVSSPSGGRTEAPAQGEATTTGWVKPKRWIRLIDSVRVYSVFGLDRVPVDTSLRGSEHQHTWDHRAAASSGPSKHICTICGRLKF